MRGLYLHIPFCSKKCVYCDFYSVETTHRIEEFVHMLLHEIALRAAFTKPSAGVFDTVFFGGGTPSLLSVEQMERIVAALHEHFVIAPAAEWTMECNPGTVTLETLKGYRALGINRLSFGVQSFFEEELKFLSRIHNASEAFDAVKAARAAGFENVNIDLMFALPNQSMERWQRTVEQAVALETEHISAYSLIFEEGTPLHAMRLRGEVQPQHEEHDVAMYEWTMNTLLSHGYEQYEVSNFARSGKYCCHNCLYWQGGEYLAFGPSAHGYRIRQNTHTNDVHERYWNVRSLHRYTEALRQNTLPTANTEQLSRTERLFERAFLELRSQGIRLQAFERDFGIKLAQVLEPLFAKYQGEDLWRITNGRLVLTQRGYTLCDAISTDVISLLEQTLKTRWQIPSEESVESVEHVLENLM